MAQTLPPAGSTPIDDEGVLVLGLQEPAESGEASGPEANLAIEVLQSAAIACRPCRDFGELCQGIESGAGCALIVQECLTAAALQAIVGQLAQQPPWSDFPVILLSGGSSPHPLTEEALSDLGNLLILQRPVSRRTLHSAIQSALRARRRQYEARRALGQRDQFLAMLGHELRNPLGAILLASELLKQSTDPEVLRRQHVVLERQARQLARLVDDLLDVARLTRGKVVLKRRPLEVNALVANSVESSSDLIKTRAQSLSVRLAAQPITVDGDAVRLEQILLHLLANATKYTQAGGQIEVAVEYQAGEAVIRVRDSGEGLEPPQLETIFELFSQGPATPERAQSGLGLGLTLVRSLVKLHDGTVTAESPGRGQGSIFTVRLPAQAGALPPAPEPVSAPVVQPLRIVIIDDNEDLREMLQAVLQSSGYQVETADDGRRGLAKVLTTGPDVALIDVGLPGIDGYEVARQVRSALGNQQFLIALTGYGQPDDRKRAREAGFDVHLTKPVSADTLRTLLAEHAQSKGNPTPPD